MSRGYQDDGKSRTLFVAKIADRITEDDLRRYFRKYGPLIRCEIKRGKGFGFVEYETRLDAEDALYDLNGAPLAGRSIEVEFSSGGGPTSSDRRRDVCFHCGRPGHIASQCPEKDSPDRCFRCGNVGHLQKNCPFDKERK